MNEFEELKDVWSAQEGAPESITSKKLVEKSQATYENLKSEQRWTIGILVITTIGLIAFLAYVTTFNVTQPIIGVSLMVAAILVRILLEKSSNRKLREITEEQSLTTYTHQLKQYYTKRKRIHFGLTPVILLTYAFGFYLLLPSFKVSLSKGFYTYIIVSGVILLFGFSYLFYRLAKKEMDTLTFLSKLK